MHATAEAALGSRMGHLLFGVISVLSVCGAVYVVTVEDADGKCEWERNMSHCPMVEDGAITLWCSFCTVRVWRCICVKCGGFWRRVRVSNMLHLLCGDISAL